MRADAFSELSLYRRSSKKNPFAFFEFAGAFVNEVLFAGKRQKEGRPELHHP